MADAGLLGRDQGSGLDERLQQDGIDVVGEPETDAKAEDQRADADDQPLAKFDEVVEQRRARGLDLGFVGLIIAAHETIPVFALRGARGLRAGGAAASSTIGAAFGVAGARLRLGFSMAAGAASGSA